LAAGLPPAHHTTAHGITPRHRRHRMVWRVVAPPVLPRAQSASPIQHIVVLFMENHSFDSLLGFWCDDNPGRCPEGGMPSSVTLSDGVVVTPHDDKDVVPLVTHNTATQLAAMNIQDGVPQMNGWQNIKECDAATHYRCISGYEPQQVPNLTALAANFAISDATFSLADSASWGGHLDIVTGNLDGFTGDPPRSAPGVRAGMGWGCDSDKLALWAASLGGTLQQEPGCIPDPSLSVPNGGAFEPTPVPYEPTIMDELSAAGLSWKLYAASCTDEVIKHDGLERCRDATPGYDWGICPSIAECLYTQTSNVASPDQFLTDAAAGDLPAFSVITPGGDRASDSEHNGFSITAGDDWMGQIASAVMNGPEWDSTALFITYDECGCFYDQVPPPLNPDGTQDGPRVPLVIVSPYAVPGYTDNTPTTSAGILAFTEQTFGLPALGVNDAQAYPFTNAFNYGQTPLRPVGMVSRPVPRGDHIDWAQARQMS
jgi:phospholipase C